MFIQKFFLKFIVEQKNAVLIRRAIFTLSLKRTRTNNNWKVPWEKNPENYELKSDETYTFEQKPINVDDFNEVEEKEVKERVEKRKQKRREVNRKK